MAAEMAIIRLTHVADLPTPEDLVRKLKDVSPPAPPSGLARPSPASGQSGPMAVAPRTAPISAAHGTAAPARALPDPSQALAHYPNFDSVVDLIRANRDVRLLVEVEGGVRLAEYQPGRIEFEPGPSASPDLAQRLGTALHRWTGNRWAVSVVRDGGAPSIAEMRDAADTAMRAEAEAHPMVQEVLVHFPKAKITAIRTAADISAEAEAEALPEVSDEWDPFEDD